MCSPCSFSVGFVQHCLMAPSWQNSLETDWFDPNKGLQITESSFTLFSIKQKALFWFQHELLFQCTEHSKTLSRIQKYLITMVSWLQALWRVFSFVCVHLLSLIYIIRNRGLIYRYYEFSRVILKTARFRRRYENSR